MIERSENRSEQKMINQNNVVIENILDKKHKDLFHADKLGLNSFWNLHHGDIPNFSINEEIIFSQNSLEQVSQYKRQIYVEKGHKYFIYGRLSCSEYSRGMLGIGINGLSNTLSITEKTNGFVSLCRIVEFKENQMINFFFGGLARAKLSGVIENATMIDLTEVYGEGREPDLETDNNNRKFPWEIAEDNFVKAMNKKAEFLDMKNTCFKNCHGLTDDAGHLSTTHDLMKLFIYAMANPRFFVAFNQTPKSILINGKNKRVMHIESNLKGEENSGQRNKTLKTQLAPNLYCSIGLFELGEKHFFACWLNESDSAPLEDQLKQSMNYSNFISETLQSASIKEITGENLMFSMMKESAFSKEENKEFSPGSLTQMMTAIVLLENINNLHEKFEIQSSDLIVEEGKRLFSGDKLTFLDALYLLLVSNSAVVAKALSRVIGEKLLF